MSDQWITDEMFQAVTEAMIAPEPWPRPNESVQEYAERVAHVVLEAAAERLPAVVRRVAAARIWKERKFVASAADRRAGIPRDVDEWLAGLIADDLRAALTEGEKP